MPRRLLPCAILDLQQQAAAHAIGREEFAQAHHALGLFRVSKVRGEIHRLQLDIIEVVDTLAGQAELVEKAVVPQHGDLVAAELDVGLDAVDGIDERPVERAARILRRLPVRAAMGEDQCPLHGNPSMNFCMETSSAAKCGLTIKRRNRPRPRFCSVTSPCHASP